MRLRLETENKTLVEVLYKKGLHAEVFAIGVAIIKETINMQNLLAHIEKGGGEAFNSDVVDSNIRE